METFAYCTAASYQLKPLYEMLRSLYKSSLYRDVIHIEVPTPGLTGDAFFYAYGTFVSWGLSKENTLQFREMIRTYENLPVDEFETDEFTFQFGEIAKVEEDDITLPNADMLTKLAISHGIAQSVKLGSFETAIQKTFNSTRQIPEDLAKRGKIALSKREIRRKMGELFIERSSINVHVDVLDTPEFFWEYPELETYYKMITNYLDVSARVQVLNQRLDIVHELFEMLGNELNHQHSSRLEWTIIWLIIIEVALTIFRDVFNII